MPTRRFKTRKRVRSTRRASSLRPASVRANAEATGTLFEVVEGKGKRETRTALALSAAKLDDVELDTAWAAAIRGDYVVASDRLTRTAKPTSTAKKKPKGWSPWRNAMLPRRK